MSFYTFFKKNRPFFILTIGFLLWLGFLIVLSILNLREVVFLDGLASNPATNVSSDYASHHSFLRYLVEPFAGIAFIIGMEFYWLIAAIIFYIIYRLIYLIFKKIGKIGSQKYKRLMYPIDNFMRFTFKIFSATILIVGMIILIGYISLGYYFVSRHFMVIIQIGVRICSLILIIKIAYILIIFIHPKLNLHYLVKNKSSLFKKNSLRFKFSKTLKRELIYIVGTVYILLGANILLISTPYPTHIIETDLEEDEFLIDFHVHSTMSDGWLTPEQRVAWYIEQGISGAFFSDHDNIRGALAARKYVETNNLDFMVFVSLEWTDAITKVHMNIYGLEEEIVAPISENPTGNSLALNASDMIKYVKSKGGYVIVNHYNYYPNPSGSFGVPYTLEQLRDWGVDGFEIVNGDHMQEQEIRQFSLDNNLICIGASDTHTSEEINAFVRLNLDDPTNKSVDNIFKNLRNNTHSVIMVNLYSNIIKFPGEFDDIGFEILEDFINYIFNLSSFQALSWILWSCLGFILFFLAYMKIKNTDLELIERKIKIK